MTHGIKRFGSDKLKFTTELKFKYKTTLFSHIPIG